MKDTTEQGKGLARKVLSPNQVCDRSKLEHLKEVAAVARTALVDHGEIRLVK